MVQQGDLVEIRHGESVVPEVCLDLFRGRGGWSSCVVDAAPEGCVEERQRLRCFLEGREEEEEEERCKKVSASAISLPDVAEVAPWRKSKWQESLCAKRRAAMAKEEGLCCWTKALGLARNADSKHACARLRSFLGSLRVVSKYCSQKAMGIGGCNRQRRAEQTLSSSCSQEC